VFPELSEFSVVHVSPSLPLPRPLCECVYTGVQFIMSPDPVVPHSGAGQAGYSVPVSPPTV
jgi:hypothetical protein